MYSKGIIGIQFHPEKSQSTGSQLFIFNHLEFVRVGASLLKDGYCYQSYRWKSRSARIS